MDDSLLPNVSIIVLSWNRREITLDCLSSLGALSYPEVYRKIVLVDNGSTDGTVNAVQSAYPGIAILTTGKNLGYAEGNNVAIRQALCQKVDYVLLLNNDARVAGDALTHLVSAAEQNPEVAFLGPKIYHQDRPNQIQSAGARLDWLWRSHQRGLDEEDTGQYDTLQQVDYVIGAVVLVRAAALSRIGLLDPDFFLYREDVDWCLRARRHGFKVLYVPQAQAWHRSHHVREQELPRITYYMTRNSLLLIAKNRGGAARFIAVLFRHLLTAAVWTMRPKWRGKRKERNALLRGIADYFRGRVGQGYA